MKVPFIEFDYELIEFKDEYKKLLLEHVKKGEFIGGDSVEKFESNLKEYLNVEHVVSVGNGTDALLISLLSLNLDKKNVIVPAFSFFATSEAVVQAGLNPIFVDINRKDCNINVNEIEKNIDENTGAILPVHLFGNAANLDQINKLAKKYDLKIVEDVAQSFGSEFNGKKLGTIGDAGCFSFFPTKTLGAYGDGGAIATNDSSIAENARMYKNHGSKTKYFNDVFGYNSRLDSIQASILTLKLSKIDKWIQSRIDAGNYYDQNLNELKEIELLNNSNSTFNYYSILVKNNQRNDLQTYLNENNISTAVYYPKTLPSLKAHNINESFPVAEKLSEDIISLPIWPNISVQELDYTIDKIFNFFRKKV